MSRLTILTDEEQNEFDYPPTLSPDAKALCFSITKELESKINHLRTPTNKVGFLIQYGYFKACKRFFVVNRFRQEDIEYAARLLGISLRKIDFSQYKKKIPIDHQDAILKLLDYRPFDENIELWIEKEVRQRVEHFIDPREVFFEILHLLHGQRIEIPSYHRLAESITRYYIDYEDKLIKIIDERLDTLNHEKLNAILNTESERSKGTLNKFTIINQSTKPKAIQASLNILSQVNELFSSLLPTIEELGLNPQSCEYYAVWLKKAKLSQIKQFTDQNKMYLHLIAFIQHQLYLRQDTCVDILLKCVQSAKNTVMRRLDESDKLTRNERRAAVRHLTNSNRNYRSLVDEIAIIAKSPALTDTGKVKKINELIEEHEKQKYEIEQEKIEIFEKSLDRMENNKDYFDVLEKLSLKLQHRVSGIVKALIFNENNSNKPLIKAINYFKNKDGQVDCKAPCEFLEEEEQKILTNDKGSFRTSLYKILLFIHIAHSIKSGELNLKYSYRYLSIQDYLIDEETWKNQSADLLKLAGLEAFKNHDTIMNELKHMLNEKYKTVNQRFLEGRNPYLSIHDDGHIQITTPALDDKDTEYIAALLDQGGYVPILRVLSEIDNITQFTKCFKHHSIKHVKRRPRPETFIAGVIGLGCNIGVPKMAKISTGVNENTLLNSVNWYFSRKTLHDANQRVIELIHKLVLSDLFIADVNQLHSSSDGRKVNVGVDSLLASYSFKYFGKDKGVSVYTFIDERQALFHSLVMSSAEREAAYVIDGLNNNDVTKVNIHSTDTHGYTELIFAATHFLDISFAPRLKNIGQQCIYAFSSRKTYEKLGYKILPSRTVNQKLIENHWDDILRFMTTIKLKKVSASQLFKRLSSYAKDNPLYKAIKEFGRVIKSLFILTYFDDVKLRQRIEKQLNRIELSNKFSNAVFYANNSEFKQGSPEEQNIAVACKVLIQNAIVLWNYLYLSQLLANCSDEKERNEMVGMIKEGSMINWAHVNLHGEFDFKRQAANDTPFDMRKILSLQLVGA